MHDLHLWALTSGKASLTTHVVYEPGALPEELLAPLKEILAERFQVFHTTLQMEAKACVHTDDGCNFISPASSEGPEKHA